MPAIWTASWRTASSACTSTTGPSTTARAAAPPSRSYWKKPTRPGSFPTLSRSSSSSERMIDVQHLTKRFALPGGSSLVAVDDVSFAVQPGEVYALLGPNGAGKTTTLRMLLGLLRPTRGQASIAGFGSAQHPDEVKRRVGLVSAGAGLDPGLTVREMLLFFADLYAV